jgi:hypothetical protein
MRRKNRVLSSLLLGAVLSAPFLTTACAVHSREVYDPYHNDYHAWNHDEGVQYHEWIVVNHKPDRPYKKLDKDDQKAYWNWRHDHGDQGHDRDHDHDHDHDHR